VSLSPVAVLVACMLVGTGLAVGGVFMLWGMGWAMLSGALPLFGVAAVLARGLIRG
jgi:hypothetical protein